MSSSISNDPLDYIAADETNTSWQPSPTHSGINAEEHSGNYSTQMDELFNDGYESHGSNDAEDNEDEGFVYTGVDAHAVPTGYADQLRDVLGSELTDDEMHTPDAKISSIHGGDDNTPDNNNLAHEEILAEHASSSLESITPVHMNTSGSSTLGVLRPFLPPGVSRLRSHTPQTLHSSSHESSGNNVSSDSHFLGGMSPSPSHFPSMSRLSSLSDFDVAGVQTNTTHSERDVFRWVNLSNISKQTYNILTQKLSSVLGAPLLGAPTVMAVNELICIGTDQGKVCVFDFQQKLRCVCGSDVPGKSVGAVTAVALSHDHTYVVSGHASGHIQLFDLKNPKVPVRSVPPTTFEAVASGRKAGHIEGSRIISVDFIAGRHTAIVSSDDHGLAFSHSLGKMLFIEAPDILRILGQYQPDIKLQNPRTAGANPSLLIPDTSLPRRRRLRYTILATAPLPSGSPYATDSYNIIALLTPSKLVVVGLKPLPRTWFKCPRDPEEGFISNSAYKGKGTLAWSPSARPPNVVLNSISNVSQTTAPVLVFTWGCALRLIQVFESRSKEVSTNRRTGKQVGVEVGRIVYQDVGRFSTEDVILAVQWLNTRQIAVLTAQTLRVFDAQTLSFIESVSFDSLTLVSPSLPSTINSAVPPVDSMGHVAHSIRVDKGKIFLLGAGRETFTLQCRNEFRVGTLLTWADRILSFVKDGDFLSAIDLARSYYVGEAPGNKNGLPDDPVLRKATIGGKMKDLMVASVMYTFSEDRMRDGTHVTPDNRGVDRTSLFEDLVTICCHASIALDDFEFLFEDLFQRFDDTGISKIFLRQLEPFVLNNDVRCIPPRVAQRLVALHEEDNRPDRIERIIWHIEPTCLDINQTIHLCQRYHLYDALIYVYTRALHDFVAPVVELLGLIRKVQQSLRLKLEPVNLYDSDPDIEDKMDSMILNNAYKIYPYLSTVLSGLSYPSEEPLPDDDALRARQEVYAFIFFGRSGVWPSGEGSRLVLTADEEGGAEPTYPYLRQLLRFDAESFLHSLDIAFEDPFLNDDTQSTNRLVIVRILLEIMAAGDLSPADSTLVNIFIARNVPKYPQFFTLMPPSTLHDILLRLADDADLDTREDRQLAAEYLLSTYNPHDSDYIIHVFESAGFYRILRSWHRQECRWGPLLAAYLDDHSLRPSEILLNVHEVLTMNSLSNEGSLSPDIHSILTTSIPQLMAFSLTDTAYLLEKHAPDLHETALQNVPDEHDQLTYLRRLLGPSEQEQGNETSQPLNGASPHKVSGRLAQMYISLQCQQRPGNVIEALKYLPTEFIDWDSALLICETEGVYDAVVWATNRRGHPQEALQKAEVFQKRLTQRMVNAVLDPLTSQISEFHCDLQSLASIATVSVAICLDHSKDISTIHVPSEDIWFQLLSSQIRSVQALSSLRFETKSQKSDQDDAMATLRTLVQKTFSSLVSVATAQAISFPRLFKRLVECAPPSMHAQYTEFRTILTGMLESYRSEGDMLVITKHLTDRDLYETMAEMARERDRGWAASQNSCARCQKSFTSATLSISRSDTNISSASKIVVSRTGLVYHDTCSN
ncbi:hypothetical protein C0992_001583 [Termitomyces sp. T32_za158]|nr:hypothetical protein C0992_001583 [Termitomyces sp. T32_za158]